MISGLTNSGATQTLEKLMQFSARRHEVLANNIANLSTPGFRPEDVSVTGFQQQLGEAVDRQRSSPTARGELQIKDSNEVQVRNGRLTLAPQPAGENLLFHDRNDRNLERTMQDMVENFMAFRTAAQFMRREFETLRTVIRERM